MSDDKDRIDRDWNSPISFLDLAEAGFDLANRPRRWAERDRQQAIGKLLAKALDDKELALQAKRNEYVDARLAEQGKGFVGRRGPMIGIVAALIASFVTVWGWIASWSIFHGALGK